MKPASLTNHAKKRIGERCGLSQEEVKQILDAGGGIPINLQKGGRYAHRLIYCCKDGDWYMVVQDGGDGGVLTIMPLDYLKGRTAVTAAHKRQARRKALDIFSGQHGTKACKLGSVEPAEPMLAPKVGLSRWRIRVQYRVRGKVLSKVLPYVPASCGEPGKWASPGPIHPWLRTALIAAEVSFARIDGIWAVGKNQDVRPMDDLLEHLPMTEEEIASCR